MHKLFQWSSKYELGCQVIDAQHQYLFSLAHQLNAVDIESSKILIKNLFRYCKVHFVQEEQHMAAHQYPNLFFHKKLHRDILRDLNNIARQGILELEALHKFCLFFLNWLSIHVLQEDMHYVSYFNTKS
jgi:hemerythrin